MGNGAFNLQEANEAIRQAVEGNDYLVEAINKLKDKVEQHFVNGDVVGGRAGERSAQAFVEFVGDFFEKTIIAETELFINDKMRPIIEQFSGYNDDTYSYYAKAGETNND